MNEDRSRWRMRNPKPETKKAEPPPVQPPDLVEAAKHALQAYWGSAGDYGQAEAASACRKLTKEQLRMLYAWVPSGQGRTAQKCEWAAEMVKAVMDEK